MARHTMKRRRPGLIWGSLAALVAVCLVTGSGIAWANGSLDDLLPTGSATPDCDATQVSVVVDPALAPVMKKIAAGYDAEHSCAETIVTAQDSADTASVLAAGGDLPADVWIPDSAAWGARTDATAASLGRPAPTAEFGDPVATTPLVFAAPAAQASAFAETPGVGWRSVLDGSLAALLPDPEASGASLAALAALGQHAPGDDPRVFAGAMIALGRSIPRSVGAALASAESASDPTVVITTEQAVAAVNSTPDEDQFLALYPSDGTAGVSYPFVRVGGASTGDRGSTPASTASRRPCTLHPASSPPPGSARATAQAPSTLRASSPSPSC